MRLLDKEKNNKITASWGGRAFNQTVNIAAFVLLAVILLFFSLAGSAHAEFGLQRFALSARNENGTPDIQAGSHPYALTNTFVLNLPLEEARLRDVHLELPPGFVGDPNATPRCTYQEFITIPPGQDQGSECSNETAIGLSTTYVNDPKNEAEEPGNTTSTTDAVYNLVPPAGVAAEFGFIVAGKAPVLLQTSVRSGKDYGLTTTAPNIPDAEVLAASKVTIWGVPASPAHNAYRGTCVNEALGKDYSFEEVGHGLRAGEDELEGPLGPYSPTAGTTLIESASAGADCATQAPVIPLLTNPTSCGTPRTATLSVDDWEEPGVYHSLTTSLPEIAGCEKLDFSPTIGVKPDGEAGSTPTGLNIDLHVPQEGSETPEGNAEADVKDTTVTLPAGVQLSPSAADGLQACSNAQIGFEGYEELDRSGVQTPVFKEKVYNPTTGQEEATLCPDASKIATVKIKTPLLPEELEGSVFLAAPQNFAGLPENPFSSLVAMYLVAEDPVAGVLVKLPGKVSLNPINGQVTTTFENTPQLPFSELKFELYGTDRAPLATPAFCGSYKTEASLTPWTSNTATAVLSNPETFKITSGPVLETASGPQASACPGGALPFSPSLSSGTPNNNAGAFSDLTTTLGREDGQQNIQSVTLHYPPGLSGLLSGVELCPEALANAGTCGPNSQVGETIVSVGLGGDPFSVTGGKVYLTGPYEGAPFGLSIVNPAKAGPFDLQEGRPVVVRAKIEVNPTTAALTVTTNTPAEGYAIPTMIEGIPLQIKHVNVNITRPGFTFNPTSCNPMSVTGSINSAEGASSPVSDPFQVASCASLKFAPNVSFSTSGKTSKADGADLITKITYPSAPQGTYANVGYVKVELPKQLPSRLTTLQKACTNAQFEANPAGCPAASKIGYAVVHTPLLPVPLEGPAIFVSHGGEAFPSLTMVLQGYGVTIDLVGTTFISKSGITSTTFKTVPDQPFSTFELILPQGPFSALAANGNLCTSKLVMPNEFVSQAGGAGGTIKQDSSVNVTGCSSALSVVSSKVNKKTLTLSVYAPAAGKVTASGKGVSAGVKTYSGHEALTFTLKQKKAGKLKTKVKLTFTPSTGKDRKKQSKSLSVKFKK
jgi:hypothetical protein